jgi:hypothetical protein
VSKKSKSKNRHRPIPFDVDKLASAMPRFESKLSPEDYAQLQAIAQVLFTVHDELRRSDATMDSVRRRLGLT